MELRPGVDSLSGIRTLSDTVTHQLGWVGTQTPLCIAICIQLQLVLTWSLYNKQSAGQIKIMAITDAGLHILSAAKVRAESMNAWVEAGGGCMKQELLPPSPALPRLSADLSSFNIWCLGLSNGLVEAVLMKWLGILLRQPGLNKPQTDKFPQCECKGH